MALQVATKKPLCIDSSVVYKIDRVFRADLASEINKTESIYSCKLMKTGRFSKYFNEELAQFDGRLLKIETVLGQIGFSGALEVVIDETTKKRIDMNRNKINISSDLVDSSRFDSVIFEAALKQTLQTQDAKLIKLLSDFFTQNLNQEGLFAELWKSAYDELNHFEKIKFKMALLKQLRINKVFSSTSLVENIQTLLKTSEPSIRADLKIFEDYFFTQLHKFNLLEQNHKFDLIIEFDHVANIKPDQLVELAKLQPKLRVGYHAKNGFYILPHLIKVPVHELKTLTTQMRLLVRYSDSSTVINLNLDQYVGNTEKLIVLRSNEVDESINYDGLFKENTENFLFQNKKNDFIQFHIPSYKTRISKLSGAKNYFSFLKQSVQGQFKQKSLGWRSVNWLSDIQAYRPVAIYDVIQYYRIN